jgi:hypothetical protein
VESRIVKFPATGNDNDATAAPIELDDSCRTVLGHAIDVHRKIIPFKKFLQVGFCFSLNVYMYG